MLKTRIIPVILYKQGGLAVKGRQFGWHRPVGSVRNAARVHAMRGVDEIFLLDITATQEGREPDWGLIRDIAGDIMSPLTVGGGIHTLDHIRLALANGADKVAIRTAAFRDPHLVRRAAERFGSQAVVVALDVLPNGRLLTGDGEFGAPHGPGQGDAVTGGDSDIFLDAGLWPRGTNAAEAQPNLPIQPPGTGDEFFGFSGANELDLIQKHPTIHWVERWACHFASEGAGELLLTSVGGEGSFSGLDEGLIASISKAVSIPVVAHGGAGRASHFADAIRAGAHAVAAGSIFHFTDTTPRMVAEFLHGLKFAVRLS